MKVWSPSADRAFVRQVFLDWCGRQLTAYMSPPTGLYNDPALLNTVRGSVNNYNSGHFRQLVLYFLSMVCSSTVL